MKWFAVFKFAGEEYSFLTSVFPDSSIFHNKFPDSVVEVGFSEAQFIKEFGRGAVVDNGVRDADSKRRGEEVGLFQ